MAVVSANGSFLLAEGTRCIVDGRPILRSDAPVTVLKEGAVFPVLHTKTVHAVSLRRGEGPDGHSERHRGQRVEIGCGNGDDHSWDSRRGGNYRGEMKRICNCLPSSETVFTMILTEHDRRVTYLLTFITIFTIQTSGFVSGPSNSFATLSRFWGIAMFCGHFSSHLPHLMQSDALFFLAFTTPHSLKMYSNLARLSLNRNFLLYNSKQPGIFTPDGHGIQYPQPVQPTFIIFR